MHAPRLLWEADCSPACHSRRLDSPHVHPLKTHSVTAPPHHGKLYSNVKDGSLDCAIVSLQEELLKDLEWIPLHSDELLAVIPEDVDYDGKDFPIELFDDAEFLMPTGGFDMDILPALNGGGHQTRAILRYTNLDDAAIISMVSHNLGYSILSELWKLPSSYQHRKTGVLGPRQHPLTLPVPRRWQRLAFPKTVICTSFHPTRCHFHTFIHSLSQ